MTHDHIRKATAADLPTVHEIIRASYSKYLPRMDRPPAPMLRDYGSAIEDGVLWVTGDPVTGLISLTVPASGDSLLVENVAVHPRAQGGGTGRRLMEFAEAESRRLRLTRLTLYTNVVMTENLAIYTRLMARRVQHAPDRTPQQAGPSLRMAR